MPAYPVDLVVRYGEHPDQLADLRLPPAPARQLHPPSALVLVVHGGFWRQEYDRHHTDPLAADLAARGYAVASVEYRRLGGAGGWPETFDDVATAVDVVPALVSSAAPVTVGLPVVLLGHSAGGHLALWAAGRHRLAPDSRWHRTLPTPIGGVVAIAPVADLARAADLGLDDSVVEELLGGRGHEWAHRLAQLDPTGLPPAAPVIVVHGARDRHVPLELGRRYVDAVRTARATVTLDVVRDAEHFLLIDPASPAWPRVLTALARVIADT